MGLLSAEKNKVARCGICGHWVRIEQTRDREYFCQCSHCKTQWPTPAAAHWNMWEMRDVFEPALTPVMDEVEMLGWAKFLRT